jgi:hypothetical protein
MKYPISPEALDVLSDVALRHRSGRAGKKADYASLGLSKDWIVIGSSEEATTMIARYRTTRMRFLKHEHEEF